MIGECAIFTNSTATLNYTPRPAGGWKLVRDIPGQVRVIFSSIMDFMGIKSPIPFQQITEAQIDYSRLVQHFGGNAAEKSDLLRRFEELKQYPPRLSLRIIRPHKVQQDLETEVTVKGVVTRDDVPLKFTVFAQSPGK